MFSQRLRLAYDALDRADLVAASRIVTTIRNAIHPTVLRELYRQRDDHQWLKELEPALALAVL